MKPKIIGGNALLALAGAFTIARSPNAQAAEASVPRFEPDPFWPKQLPNKWMLGQVSGIYVDSQGNIYLGESFGMRALRWNYKGMAPAADR